MTDIYPAAFMFCVEQTLEHEGFFSDYSWDPGGKTKFGITQALALQYGYLIQYLTPPNAIHIYFEEFWKKLHLSQVRSLHVANEIFDTAVNTGRTRAIEIVQDALIIVFGCTIARDGKIGPQTLTALNETCEQYERQLVAALNGMQFNYYLHLEKVNKPLFDKAIKGWMKRVYPKLPVIELSKYRHNND